jgi:hypothetical protein
MATPTPPQRVDRAGARARHARLRQLRIDTYAKAKAAESAAADVNTLTGILLSREDAQHLVKAIINTYHNAALVAKFEADPEEDR